MREVRIGKNQCGQRLDKFLRKYLSEAPQSFVYKMLRKKNIKRNGKRAEGKEILDEGDVITLYLAEETIDKFSASTHKPDTHILPKIALDIIYEDDHIVLINKPAGMLSQKARVDDVSLVEYFGEYVGSEEVGFQPGICNRLDRNTSGMVIGGKSLAGLQEVSRLLRDRKMEKYYLAVVCGVIRETCICEAWLSKDENSNKVFVADHEIAGGSYIKTGYEPLAWDESLTLLRVHLYTGKTHQIRAHLAQLGYPILGDKKYGGKMNQIQAKRQLLHAYELKFPKVTGCLSNVSGRTFVANLPDDFCPSERVERLLKKGGIRK